MNESVRIEQAREQGRAARRAGRPQGSNPYRGHTPLIRALNQAYAEGWREQDSERRAARAVAR